MGCDDVAGLTATRQGRCTSFMVGALFAATLALAGLGGCGSQARAEAKEAARRQLTAPVEVRFAVSDLPVNVAEMRDAILAATLSGDLKELLIPLQWNELPPDLGAKSVKETLQAWRKASHDGTGREMLAHLADILTSPYAVRRQGPDIENANVFIWPAFAEIPLDNLTSRLEVELLRLLSVEEVKRMKKAGRYDGYGVAIGADGTWHAFKRVRQVQMPAKK